MSLMSFCSKFGSEYLFMVVVSLVLSHGVQSLQFTTEPLSMDATEGRPIILQCAVDEANVQIQWTLDGQTLDIDNDDRLSLEENNLRIAEVDKDLDAGEFRCIASQGTETITSSPATLNINWISSAAKVILKVPESKAEVTEGSRVTLQCKSDGDPEPAYMWYKDDTEVQPSDNLDLASTNRLKIKSFTPENSGIYSCKAENSAGVVWSTAGNITLTLEDPSEPSVLVAPEDILAVVGDTVRFNCSFEGDPQPSVLWYYREQEGSSPVGPLTNGDGTNILDDGTLILEEVKSGDAGTFLCIPRSDGGMLEDLVLEANLVIAKVDDLLPLGPQVVAERTMVRINCTFPNNAPGGIPLPEITWYDSSGTKVTDNRAESIHVEGSFLVFTSVTSSQAGQYTCKASNAGGEKETQVTVEIASAPEITVKPKDDRVREMTNAMIHCQATGNPNPSIKWTKEAIAVEGQRFETLDNGTLLIHNVQVDDGGVYVCKATNIAGYKMAHATFLVEVVLKFNPQPISKTLEQDEQGKLTCNAQASPSTPPKVQWFKRNGETIEAITDSHIVTGNGSLIFKPAVKTDAGHYTCVATAGTDIINATVKVEVYVKPKFTKVPKNTTGYEGYPLHIDCQARGDPTPAITWTSIAPNKLPTHFNSLENGTLVVDQVLASDGGRYQCVAGNRAGLNTTEIVITVKKGSPPTASAFSPQLMTRTIAIAVGCAAAYIILVIGLMWWCRHRRRKQRRLYKEEEKANGAIPHGEGIPLNNEYQDNPAVVAASPNHMAYGRGARRASYDKMQFPRHDLQSIAVIGHGAFGEVFLARAVGIRDGEEATTVMVKALQTRDEHQQLEFRREIDMLTKLNHANIIKLLGLCREAEPQLMITEYLDWGDLKQYLRATRGENGTTNNPPPLTMPQKIDIINQVALGMEHLSNNRFIHADLAARNCLLSPSMEVKVCFMGTSKDLYRAEYHDYHQCLMPVRWMPAEALFEDDLSTKSDVWAYGVFTWEVFSQGELPYSNLDNDAFMKAMVDGEASLKMPEGTPEEVQLIAQRCWSFSPKDRYSFSDIVLAMANVSADSSV